MTKTQPDRESELIVARRYFLKAGVYAAPAIASIIVVEHVQAQPMGSCMPGEVCMPFNMCPPSMMMMMM